MIWDKQTRPLHLQIAMFITMAVEKMNPHKMVSTLLKPISYQAALIYIIDMVMLH